MAENQEYEERVRDALERIAEIPAETSVPEPFRDYFRKTALFLLGVKKDADNRSLYEDILPEHYDTSYSNPDYAAEKLGPGMGPLLAAVYAELRGIIPAVFEDDYESCAVLYELFLLLYFEFENEDLPREATVREIFGAYIRDYLGYYVEKRIAAQLDPSADFVTKIIMESDLSDPSYLYRYGEYVTENTVKTAVFMAGLPEETVTRMAEAYTRGFREGFVHAGKDLSKKKTVQIIFELGFERMVRKAIQQFAEMGLSPTFTRYSPVLAGKSPNRHAGYTGAVPNMQFDYDHREDLALVMDEAFVSQRKRAAQEAFEKMRIPAGEHAGPAVLMTFGETPFVPRQHEACIRMTKEETKRNLDLLNGLLMIRQRYIPETERSFTIIAFPTPGISDHFEEIFQDTIRVNTLDSGRYSAIQQKLIDALDQGEAVRVKGMNGNRTNLTVRLHPLCDPKKETIFENCVADVNIPVGEVFTSPVLKGTEGTLHVKRVFLEDYEFIDLELSFRDGMISTSSCGNYENEEENRKYIEENILFHHPTLPLGEFAIGTNTTAFVMARKYGIESRLPILIAEKTGPHFAVGDTCYSHEEDNPVFNPDGKEIIARDNEHTLIRKTDPSKAYYGCHTDITIPYEELGEVTVIKRDGGEIPLLREGRFVLPGTEELNIPLDGK